MIEAHSTDASTRTIGDYFVDWLSAHRISQVFTLPGGMIAALLDAIHRHGDIELITMHHEQGVAFAADGVGRFTGLPVVALATAGPGATNMLTAIGSAYLDSVPAVFVVGQVQSYLLKGDRPVRQFGFQECDVVAMAAPVTKGAWRALSADDVPALLDRAVEAALEGRPGPVLVELPADVQTAPIPSGVHARPAVRTGGPAVGPAAVAELLDAVAAAQRPLVLLGGGIHAARAAERCRRFVRRLAAPVAASVTALDVLPADDPLRLGMIGMYGNRWVNHAVSEADVLLVLGSKLDFGTLGADVASLGRKVVLQVDCDAGEMQRVRRAHRVVADLGAFFDAADPLTAERDFPRRPEWSERVRLLRERWPDTDELSGCTGINPNVLIQQLSAASAAATAFVIDAGQHLWWACQSFRPDEGQRFLPALGLGPCGWALPAAVGVAIAARRPVVLVAGDGAFQFNLQELQTVVRNRLPVKMVIVDNGSHGSVRQLQEQVFDGRYPTTVLGYDAPDFAKVADAYGVVSETISKPDEVDDALRWLWRDPDAPALLHVHITQSLNVYPNVPFGAPITAMESQRRMDPADDQSFVEGRSE